jgi:hypothetical protein
MRTVTFSDSQVAEHVNANFVPLWVNRGKGFHNCEHRTEEGIFYRSAEAYTTKNICTFFLDGEGQVVHYLAGYYAPSVFLDLLRPLDALRKAGSPEDVRSFHRERLQAKPLAPSDRAFSYLGRTHEHSDFCKKTLAEATSYVRRVHEQLAKDGRVPFEKVRTAYLFGNPFTEEASGAAGFPKPQPPARGPESRP